MRSDPADRAGGSASDGFIAARVERRRRRVAQLAALLVGALGALVATSLTAPLRAALVAGALVAVWGLRPKPDAARWRRGSEGEAATAALLEALPSRRWAVFHDRAVPGSRANLDHVVIGPTGVWVIDSKAFRSRLRAGWRSVRAGDHVVDTGTARWEASIVAERLDVEVRPVLAVLGDGLPSRGRRVEGVAVLPAPSVLRRLRRRRGSARLRRRDVHALAREFDRVFRPASSSGDRFGRPAPVARP